MRDKLDLGTYFELRPGIGQFPRWEGVRFDSDPGSLPANALALGVNVRFDPGGVRSRKGIKVVATLPTYSPVAVWAGVPQEQINWIGMHHMQFRAPRLWVASPGCFTLNGVSEAAGAFLRWYNPDKSPETQAAGNFVGETTRLPTVASYGGEMYFADWGVLQKPNVVEAVRGEPIALGYGESYTEQVVGFPGRDLTAMQEFDGKLFVALRDPAGAASTVGYWDGVSRILDDKSTTTTYGVNFCVWRDAKLVMVQSGSATVHIRDASGTWSTVALPGALNNDYKNSLVEFRDEIYVASSSNVYKISDFDAPTASTVHTFTANYAVRALATLGDNLYYLYNYWTGSGYEVYLGLYEPDLASGNWMDAYKQIDPEVSPQFALPPGGTTLTVYRNRLYAGGGTGRVVAHTLPYDPTSTWFDAVSNVGTLGVSSLRVG